MTLVMPQRPPIQFGFSRLGLSFRILIQTVQPAKKIGLAANMTYEMRSKPSQTTNRAQPYRAGANDEGLSTGGPGIVGIGLS